MDLKGTWVDNVYQKFEAMCLEVEEIIVQDTAKYVENQVQTVGNTVKKFYSDVVQDLLPDDSAGSLKPLPVSMLHEYAPVCSFKKKRESMNQKTRDVKQEQEVTEGKKDRCAVKYRGLDADDYDICTSPRQYRYGGPYRRIRPGRKQIFKKEEIFKVTRPYIKKESSSLSMVHSTRVKDDVGAVNSSDSPPGEVERHIFKEDCQKDDRAKNQHDLSVVNSLRSQDSEMRTENEQSRTVVKSVRSQDSEMRAENEQSRTVVKSIRSQDSEMRTENEQGRTVVKSIRSQDSEMRTENEQGRTVVNSIKSQESEMRTENEQGRTVVNSIRSQDSEVRTENEQGHAVVNSIRSQDSEIQPTIATNFPAGSDNCRKETNEDSMETSSRSGSDQKPEILQHLSERSVEESCILVDRDEYHCVFPNKENNKHKPYKKIRDAISSRMTQNRSKEYKRLARQWYAEDVENGRECGDDPKQIEENRSTEESEWELL